MDKAALVKSVQALPTVYSGTIKVAGAQSRIMEDVAMLSCDTDETETVFATASVTLPSLSSLTLTSQEHERHKHASEEFDNRGRHGPQ